MDDMKCPSQHYIKVVPDTPEFGRLAPSISHTLQEGFKSKPLSTSDLKFPQYWIVAHDGNEIMGLCAVSLTDRSCAYMSHLCVRPKYQRRGVGSDLLKWLRIYGQMEDLDRIYWEVEYENTDAHMFYLVNNATFVRLFNTKDDTLCSEYEYRVSTR
jgi:ribosomal protein S18 acetylase RimI-like enzyme